MDRRGVRLRWLLVFVVLLAALPTAMLHLGRLQSSSHAAIQTAYRDAAELARLGLAEHAQAARQARQLLEILVQVPAIRNFAASECDEILRSAQESREWISVLFVVNADGKGLCGSNAHVRQLDVRDREHFRQVRESGRFTVSDAIIGRVTGAPVLAASLPLHGEGGFQGALGLGVRLSWIDQVAAAASKTFGGMLIVLDRAGRVLAYQSASDTGGSDPRQLESLGQSPLIEAIRMTRGETFEATDADGVDRLFSVARAPDLGLTVAVGIDRIDVVGAIERGLRQDLLFLLMVMAGSICLAFLVAELGLLRGVQELKAAALKLKAGKMGLRVRLPSYVASELHDLAATYNSMTAEFERLAYLDRLTGLPNRRYLERHMNKRNERGEPARPGRNAVLAIDIDGFKPVNDGHGHAVGDRVLAIIARRIASAIDQRGLLFRVGGDEFVAIAPLTKSQDRGTAHALGEEIRQAMEQTIEADGLLFPVACSVGVALVPEDATTLAGALEVADAALYEAKRSGRNRVVDAPSLASVLPEIGLRACPVGSKSIQFSSSS